MFLKEVLYALISLPQMQQKQQYCEIYYYNLE